MDPIQAGTKPYSGLWNAGKGMYQGERSYEQQARAFGAKPGSAQADPYGGKTGSARWRARGKEFAKRVTGI